MIDRDHLVDTPHAAINTLLHEPQHDKTREGVGRPESEHSKWASRIEKVFNRAEEIVKNTPVQRACCDNPIGPVQNAMDGISVHVRML